MSCLEGLMAQVARDVEGQLKPQLTGLFGGVIRGYLPQVWVFETDDGTVSLTVDKQGIARAAPGAMPAPDVTVRTTHARLRTALATRSREAVPPGPLTVTPHTEKGRTAFGVLAKRLGL